MRSADTRVTEIAGLAMIPSLGLLLIFYVGLGSIPGVTTKPSERPECGHSGHSNVPVQLHQKQDAWSFEGPKYPETCRSSG